MKNPEENTRQGNAKSSKAYDLALGKARKKKNDPQEILSLLRKAIDEGDPRAAYALATWYLHGTNVRRNFREAAKLLRLAAKENIPEALYDLAICYEKGAGVKKNERMALEHYIKAALHGHEQSIYEVGRCYYYGIGIEANRRIANIWFDRGDELGLD